MSYFYFNGLNLFSASVPMVSLDWWPHLCGEPQRWEYARGKNQRVGERGEEKTPWAGLLKQFRKSNRDLMQAEDQGQDRK